MFGKVNLINGNFITLDKHCPKASSISINNGKISAINSLDPKAKNIDLKNTTIIPGFIDAHFHLKNFGKRLIDLNLKNATSAEDIVRMVKNKAQSIPNGMWIEGFGWDQTKWINSDYPKKHLLNEHIPNHPIILTRIDGHSAWINEAAIKQSDKNLSQLKSIAGGQIINDCIFIDNAMNHITKLLPIESIKKIETWIETATKKIIERGITNVHDAWQDTYIVKAINNLIKKNKFPIRCYGMLASSDKNLLSNFFKKGPQISELYTIRSVKAFIDGALGSRGASLLKPYNDDPTNCGLVLITFDEFLELAEQCNQSGFQLCTHAIGDNGNRIVLDVYDKKIKNVQNHRWRIEHAQMVTDEDIPRFKKNNILPSMQPSHCTSDMRWMKNRIGKSRMARISRWQTFISNGNKIPGGSDCPIEEGNPIFEYFAAVTRQDHTGFPKNGWQPQEKIDRINALKMFTTWAAFGEFSEHRRGKIFPGFDADLTVLSDDLTKCSDRKILNIETLMTIIGGKIVYSKI